MRRRIFLPLHDFGILELTSSPHPRLGAEYPLISALSLTTFGHEMLTHLQFISPDQ
jgi:hypothetical protein